MRTNPNYPDHFRLQSKLGTIRSKWGSWRVLPLRSSISDMEEHRKAMDGRGCKCWIMKKESTVTPSIWEPSFLWTLRVNMQSPHFLSLNTDLLDSCEKMTVYTSGHGCENTNWQHRIPVSLSFYFILFLLFYGSTHSICTAYAYPTATATQDPSRIWDLHYSSRQHRILNPLTEVKDQTWILVDPSRVP